MEYNFAQRVKNLKPSAIREIFKYSANPEYIPLSAGNPAPDAFPSAEISEISAKMFEKDPVALLQYSTTEGYGPLRSFLTGYMDKMHNINTAGDDILITSGAQQIMDLLTKSMIDPGDVVLCESPSFIGSLNTFRSYEATLKGIDIDEDGINLEKLENALNETENVKYLYTIPNFQNPSGITMSLEKRKAVYEICKKYGVLILEDNPYGDLRFRGEDIPPIKSFDNDGIVVYAGSFSKVISPGMRVGYVIGPKSIIQKMVVCKQGEDVHTNIWAQSICYNFLNDYDFDAHLRGLRKIYIRKAGILEDAMQKYFVPKNISWSNFDGGLFAWCTLPDGIDMLDFCSRALEKKVCVVPGTAFLTDENIPCSSFRVNFSTPSDEQLTEGIKRLSELC